MRAKPDEPADPKDTGKAALRPKRRGTVIPGTPPRMVAVKGIGRNSQGRYCEDCGHPRGRCVCHVPDEPDAAA